MSEYTCEQGKRYRATVTLGGFEAWADNETVAEKFREVGFEDVTITGDNVERIVEGTWNKPDATADIPDQVTDIVVI